MRNFPHHFWNILYIRYKDLTTKPVAFYKITWQLMKGNLIIKIR